MCWDSQGVRFLCHLTESEARNRVKELLNRYNKGRNITIAQAMYIYAPTFENNTARHIGCIEKHSGISAQTKISNLFW